MMTLTRYALTIAGPRDALINLILNGAITWSLLRSTEQLPLVGKESAAMFLGPMVFLLFTLATYFGVGNGVRARQRGLAGEPLDLGHRWRFRALCIALSLGGAALTMFLLLIYGLAIRWPNLSMTGIGLIALQSLSSAWLGYFVQVNGVLLTRRL